MADKKEGRRIVLSCIVGGFVGTTWKKPLVEAVVLPAHAETTAQCPASSLVLSGTSVPAPRCETDISDPDLLEYISYDIDDSDVCSLKYVVGAEQESANGRINIIVEYDNAGFYGHPLASIEVKGLDRFVGHGVNLVFYEKCYRETTTANGPFEGRFVGESGKGYMVTGIIDDDGERVFLSDMVLSPE